MYYDGFVLFMKPLYGKIHNVTLQTIVQLKNYLTLFLTKLMPFSDLFIHIKWMSVSKIPDFGGIFFLRV